jgi:hypothetical protein
MEATLMNPAGIISTGVLLLLLGAIIPTYAQQEEAKPPKKEQQAKPEKKQQNKAAKHQQQGQAKGQQQQARGQQQQQQRAQQRRQGQNKQQQQKQQQARGQQQQRQRQVNQPSQQEQRGHAGEHRAVWQEHRAHNWQSEHRNWRERGGYNGYRIPNDRYRGHFGPNHWFRVYRYPVEMYGGYPRFQYGGFWFGFMDPWPEYWAANWYENDDVYIVYSEDGYYLYNRRHPRDRIAITVYVN